MITATYRALKDGPKDVGTKGAKVLGLANVVLNTGTDEEFVINSVRVIRNAEGKEYVQMPSFNVAKGDAEPKWVEPAHPISQAGRAAMEKAIFEAKAKAESAE